MTRKRPTTSKKKPRSKAVKIEAVDSSARRLHTVGPDNSFWAALQAGEALPPIVGLSGAIARVRPPSDASKQHVDAVAEHLRAAGCEVVNSEPPAPGAEAVPGAARESVTVGTHREIVERLAAAAHSRDRKALEALCSEVMVEEGL